MTNRAYFVFGDLISNLLVGAVVGWMSWLLVGPGWNMLVAMFVAMGLGMVAALVLFLPMGLLFGAIEVMISTMLSGMLSGMVVGMWAAMSPLTAVEGTGIGALTGLLTLAAVWCVHLFVRGEVKLAKGDKG